MSVNTQGLYNKSNYIIKCILRKFDNGWNKNYRRSTKIRQWIKIK